MIERDIQVGSLFTIVQFLPDSAGTEDVSVKIRRLSDDYTWNFSTTEFTASATTGSMTFDADGHWKETFTPPTVDTYVVTITDNDHDIVYSQILRAKGAVAESGSTGEELTTRANVKAALKIATAQTSEDDFIDSLITRESKAIQTECNRVFNDQDFTEYRNGDGTAFLLLKNYPINSISAIYDDTSRVYGASTQIDNDVIVIDPEFDNRVFLDGSVFQAGIRNIKAVYNAGYSTIPGDLEQGCILRVMLAFILAKNMSTKALAKLGYSSPEQLRKEADRLIQPYKRYG